MWQLTLQLTWSNVEKQCSLRVKMAHVTYHLCRLFFKSSRKRHAGTDLSLFHTVFTENNVSLAVTQQRDCSVSTVRDYLILFNRENGGFRDPGDRGDSKVQESKEKGWVINLCKKNSHQ